MNWMIANNKTDPPRNRVLLCFCPEWSDTGYQVAKWNGKEFYYDEMPNGMFSEHVAKWTLFLEAD